MSLISVVEAAVHKNFDTTYDVDTTDRVKYVYSIWLLCAGAVLFFATSYVGKPLQCWVPNQFSGHWEDYAESYCFIENTYFVPDNSSNLPKHVERYAHALRWYQWVPVILALEALILYAPRLLWKVLQSIQGVTMSVVTVEARRSAKKEMEEKFKAPVSAARIRESWRWGRKLTMSLLLTKFISIVVIFFQIFSLDWIIFGDVFYPFGLSVMVDLLRGRQWQESGAFPRVTFCDFEVRELGQVHKWSLQCVLMVNMYNEKVFVFIWWWLVFLLLISLVNMVKWILRITGTTQDYFVQRVVQCFTKDHLAEVSLFRKKVLRTDGVTLLHLIEENATIYQAADFIQPMWEEFVDKNE